jgi:cyclopropane fatty-acyl-phospholipid synthase-like methyltransferase
VKTERSENEQALVKRFTASNERGATDVMRRIERLVNGCDYGGTSWATRQEIDDVGAMLNLGPGDRLLEVGAGTGWPGLYLAEQLGCDVMLTDVPENGLRLAMGRAASDHLAGACWAAAASGAALPFPGGSFDAISHSDVLCCLEPKQAVLESCRRVIRSHGQMVFSVIFVAQGLSDGDHERVVDNAPPHAVITEDYGTLLERTGWRVVAENDLLEDYLATAERYLVADEGNADDLRELIGEEARLDRLDKTRHLIELIGDRKIRRSLFRVVPA